MNKSAIISDCGLFRYELTRMWDNSLPCLGFVMLNPSTADANIDDPTIRKCIGFAKKLGYGSIIVTNLFAYRATSPKALKANGYQIGEHNNDYIFNMTLSVDNVICAWGVNARGLDRATKVLKMIEKPLALRLTPDGIPWHPLMLPYSCEPILIKEQP